MMEKEKDEERQATVEGEESGTRLLYMNFLSYFVHSFIFALFCVFSTIFYLLFFIFHMFRFPNIFSASRICCFCLWVLLVFFPPLVGLIFFIRVFT